MKRLMGVVILAWMTIHSFSQEKTGPYNPEADVRADLNSAVKQAKAENKHVLVQFGDNWCPWCIRFHKLVEESPQVDSLVRADYIQHPGSLKEVEERQQGPQISNCFRIGDITL